MKPFLDKPKGMWTCRFDTHGQTGNQNFYQELEGDVALEELLHTPFRGSAARCNYLLSDRIDIQFAKKYVCRSMALPTNLDWKAVKRSG